MDTTEMENGRDTLEHQLFTWEDWNDEGPMSMQFSNVTLKVPVGDYPAGTTFPHAFILGEASLLVLVDDEDEEHGFELNVSVGRAVQPEELGHGSGHDACGCGHEH